MDRIRLIFGLATGVAASCAAADVSIRSLLLEMSDLDRLTRVPNPQYKTAQASSYDRASKSPTENWFANADFGQFLAVERRPGRNEYVMADLRGPGAVVRIWSANPAGNIRFYVDGQELPELVIPFAELLGGKHPDFLHPFSGSRGQGWNLYYPIPYSKSMRITLDDVEADPKRVYYHVGYRTYPAGTRVQSFSMIGVKDGAKIAERVAGMLLDPQPASSFRERVISEQKIIAPGEIMSVRTPAGSGALHRLSVRAHAPAADPQPEDLLREIEFDAEFDGELCVNSPLGDFFGIAPGFRSYQSLPFSLYEETGFMISRWVMPQKLEGRLFFTNRTTQEVQVNVEMLWTPRIWTNDSMLFKAKWRRQTLKTHPHQDWNFLTATGTGRYVGAAMFVANPTSQWWGEGDEKIYVDGEAFPSTFGTGTEDYFGYAWCSPILFQHPFHNQLRCDGPGNRGYTAVNRFHISDDIFFTRSFRFDMEIWHWADVVADFAVVAYWYQRPGGEDGFAQIPPDLFSVYVLPEPPRVKGAIEGEDLRPITHTGGTLEVQTLDDRWSNGKQIWWKDGDPRDRAAWVVESSAAGRQRLRGHFCIANDYGIIQLYWNGQKLGEPIDFYSAGLSLKLVDFGEVTIEKQNRLEAEIVGANPAAIKRHMFAIDYLLIGEPDRN